MNRIYFDNAATSYPKAPGVATAMKNYIENIGVNIGRGTYSPSFDAASVVYETRELLARLFNFNNPLNVIFTMNITHSLNILLKGLLRSGDHVLVSSMEHNAVMRPLNDLINCGITYDRVICDTNGQIELSNIERLIKSNTKLLLMTHASNVCGTILPIEQIGELCKSKGIFFIIDAAQTAGNLDIDFERMHLSALAFTGHKSLLGPQGLGGFLITDELANQITPLITGGTGSLSESEYQPSFMPDKFEAGTINLPGIFGLNSSLKYIFEIGIPVIHKHEMELTKYFINNVSRLSNIDVIGLGNSNARTSVVSLNFIANDNAEVAFQLDNKYKIMTRVGLHCAPSAHKTLNTYPHGTVRFSFGYFNTKDEVDYCLSILENI